MGQKGDTIVTGVLLAMIPFDISDLEGALQKEPKKGSLKYRFSDTVFLPIIFYEENHLQNPKVINCLKNMSGANIPKKLSNFVKLLVNL